MDLSYLLWLQGIREGAPFAEQFFSLISAIAASSALVIIPCLLYWCFDKRAGAFIVFSFSIGMLITNFTKILVCCYRPWVRSADIRPAESALAKATSYSFPSGHSTTASSLIGGLGWYYRNKSRILFALCWVFVLLVAFSRNFLGVHTPQDVVVGVLVGVFSIYAARALMSWLDGGQGRDNVFLVAGLVVSVVAIAVSLLKPYPLDYDSTGALLADPYEAQTDVFKTIGCVLGVVVGWYLEHRFVRFEVTPHMGAKRIALRLVVGSLVLALFFALSMLLKAVLDYRWYELIKYTLIVLSSVFVGPAAFSAAERRMGLA